MTSNSWNHQQAAADAGAPYGVFNARTGSLLWEIPESWGVLAEEDRASCFRQASGCRPEVLQDDMEILLCCHVHPGSSAVDCLDCVPLDSPEVPS